MADGAVPTGVDVTFALVVGEIVLVSWLVGDVDEVVETPEGEVVVVAVKEVSSTEVVEAEEIEVLPGGRKKPESAAPDSEKLPVYTVVVVSVVAVIESVRVSVKVSVSVAVT